MFFKVMSVQYCSPPTRFESLASLTAGLSHPDQCRRKPPTNGLFLPAATNPRLGPLTKELLPIKKKRTVTATFQDPQTSIGNSLAVVFFACSLNSLRQRELSETIIFLVRKVLCHFHETELRRLLSDAKEKKGDKRL